MKLYFHPNISVIEAALIANKQGMALTQDGRGNLNVTPINDSAKVFTLKVKGAPNVSDIRQALKRSHLKMKVDYALTQKPILICLKNVVSIIQKTGGQDETLNSNSK